MINNKVRITSFILLVVTMVVAFYSNVSLMVTKNAFNDMDKAFEAYKEAYSCIDTFQEGSDYLTNQIRKYAINMNTEYVDNYFREVDQLKRRETSIAKLQTFSQANKLELELFTDAMELSKELEEYEIHAMKLMYMIEPYDNVNPRIYAYELSQSEILMNSYNKQKAAYEIVFGIDYNTKKDELSEKIKISKNLIAENNIDINDMSVNKAEAAIEMLSVYWGMFSVVAVGALLVINIYQFSLLFKKKKHSEDE